MDTTNAKRYVIDTKFPIKKGDYNNRISSYPQVKVYDTNSVERQVFFEELPQALTGIDSITIKNGGQNYSSPPVITIIGDGSGATATAKIAGGRITGIIVTNVGQNYTRATVSITGGGGSGGVAIAVLQSKTGILRSYYNKTNGEKIIVNPNAGTVDYDKGILVLNSFITNGTVTNDFYDTNVLTFNFPIEKEIITPLRNRILSIDQNDPYSMQMQVVAES